MLRTLALLVLTAAAAQTVRAQSVQPAVVEYVTAGDGRFDVVNDSLLPMVVTVEAKSFTIGTDGVAKFTALDPSIHLQLSETSLRLPPHARRTVFYRATADKYPAWFCVYSSFSGLPKRGAMNLALELPHTVYLRSKTAVRNTDLTFENMRVEAGELRATVRNHSSNMLRVQSLQMLTADGHHAEQGGFPLLPGGVREIALPQPAAKATGLRAKVDRYTVEAPLP